VLVFTADEGEECEISYKDKKGKYQGQQGITWPKTLKTSSWFDVFRFDFSARSFC